MTSENRDKLRLLVGTLIMASELRDKNGIPIHVGDLVETKVRRGQVQAIFTDDASTPAEKLDDLEITILIRNPPKVVLLDQKGSQFSQNPSILSHTSNPSGWAASAKHDQESEPEHHSRSDQFTSVRGKDGLPIHVSETVMTPYRGGRHQGKVEAIFTNNTTLPTEREPDHNVHIPVANPPKVVFTTERNKQVAHNPSALRRVD